eukprot:5457024-Pyramimonas_sp.AAC.1
MSLQGSLRCIAGVFIVTDPARPGDRIELAAVLKGGYVMSARLLLESNGPGIKYADTLHTRRKVWITPDFEERHKAFASILREAPVNAKATGAKVHMTFLKSDAEFDAAKSNAVTKKRPTS